LTSVTLIADQGELRIERVVTTGTFSLDGGTWDVENNVWLVGSDDEVIVIDAAHDANRISDGVGGRDVAAIVCTHGHDDHINAAVALADAVCAPVLLHPADEELWRSVHGDATYLPIVDGQRIGFAGTEITVVHTPGHSYGSVCLYMPDIGTLFSGDTLFAGGPGATGRSYSDFPTIIGSIRDRILALPDDTQVHPGHGESTTVGNEAPSMDHWITRGH
jgi:glyoxylase-like metal-dependent hydrolase (beta-lactamase superfamily II)